MKNSNEVRQVVLEKYSQIAESNNQAAGCCDDPNLCCGSTEEIDFKTLKLGYSNDELNEVPEGANMALGCGNPQAIAAIRKGEVVVDLGSGGGFDAFLAARQVGENGKVIGVDMSPAMIHKARKNAEKGEFSQVEFHLGEIEHLPVADGIADVIISNCVINLSPEKEKVFKDAFRVLKPGGRLAISDVVAYDNLPETILSDLALYVGCVSGASPISKLEQILKDSGFENISIKKKDGSDDLIKSWDSEKKSHEYVFSANIEAIKPL